MLTYDEQKKMERLMADDEDVRHLITTMKNDYQLTLSQISHEIRNPLTYMNSSVQWIQKMHPEVEEFEFWDQLKGDIQYMKTLLDDISVFNHGEELKIVPMDLREFAADLKDTLLAELLERHIVLIVKLDESYPEFYGDPIRLKQACINLLKNAMESITGRGKIILKLFVQEKKLLIAVKDNGCGMTSEQLRTIFHPFVTYKDHGTGLGLPIVRKIVTAHGGTVRASSTPGKGSEFQIYLPLLRVPSFYL